MNKKQEKKSSDSESESTEAKQETESDHLQTEIQKIQDSLVRGASQAARYRRA